MGYLLLVTFDNHNEEKSNDTRKKDTNNNDKNDKNDHITIIMRFLIIEIIHRSSSNNMKGLQQ